MVGGGHRGGGDGVGHRDGVLTGGPRGGAARERVAEELAKVEPVEDEALGEAVAGRVGGDRGARGVGVWRRGFAVCTSGRANLPVCPGEGVCGLVIVDVAAEEVWGV